MQGFYNITEKIRVQLAQDVFVNTITYGDIFRVDLKKQTIFPLSHVVVNNATMEGNVFRYNISVMAMDIVDISKDAIDNTALGQFRGNDNEQDVLNTQFAVIARLLKVLESGDLFTELYQLDGNPNIEPFTERFENYLAGWVASFDVLIPNDMTSCDAATIPSPSCADATAITTDSLGNQLYSNSIPSGDTETQVIQDSTAVLKDTIGTFISSTSIIAEGSEAITAPNAKLHIKKENDGTITNLNLLSNSENDYIVDNNDISVNGVLEFDIHATEPLDIRLRDTSNAVITPNSVTESGNHVTIVLPSAPSPRSTATLMRTGQTTVYRTGDDADTSSEGRPTDFLTLDAAPLHNDGAATLNTTTNRFTDELGGQTYTNNIVLDWSTWNGSTLLGYTKNISTGALKNWDTAIDNALATSIGSFTSDWRLTNRKELENIILYGGTTVTVINYPPFNQGVATNLWTSTTYAFNTLNAHCLASTGNGSFTTAVAKTIVLGQFYAVRTFSLSTSNVLS